MPVSAKGTADVDQRRRFEIVRMSPYVLLVICEKRIRCRASDDFGMQRCGERAETRRPRPGAACHGHPAIHKLMTSNLCSHSTSVTAYR